MKKYLVILLICFYPFLAFCDVDTIEGTATSTIDTIEGSIGYDTVEGATVAAEGGPDVYYYSFCDDESCWDTYASLGAEAGVSAEITVTVGGTITHVGFKLNDNITGNCLIALHDNSNNLESCTGNISNPTAGWVDAELDTPYVAASSEVVQVGVICDVTFNVVYDNANDGKWNAAEGFETWCEDPLSLNADPEYGYAVRVYVD